MKDIEIVQSELKEAKEKIHPDLRQAFEFILTHLKSRKRHRGATNVPQLYFRLKAKSEPQLPPLEELKEVFAILAEIGVGELDESTRDMRFEFNYEVQSVGRCGLDGDSLKPFYKSEMSHEVAQSSEEATVALKAEPPSKEDIVIQKFMNLIIPLSDHRKVEISIPENLRPEELDLVTQTVKDTLKK